MPSELRAESRSWFGNTLGRSDQIIGKDVTVRSMYPTISGGRRVSWCGEITEGFLMRYIQNLTDVHTWGLRFTNAEKIDHVTDAILEGYRGRPGQLPLVVTPNVDILITLEDSSEYVRSSVESAAIVLADGQPLVSFSHLAGEKLTAKLAGSDLTESMWPRLISDDLPAFAVVSNADVGIKLATEHAGFGWTEAPILPAEEGSLIDRFAWDCIHKISMMQRPPAFIFVGIGFPKDVLLARSIIEQWPKHMGQVPLVLAVGASLEYTSGQKKRAPKIFQRLGIEFVYRMCSDPRRLVKRYLVRDSRFLLILGRHIFR